MSKKKTDIDLQFRHNVELNLKAQMSTEKLCRQHNYTHQQNFPLSQTIAHLLNVARRLVFCLWHRLVLVICGTVQTLDSGKT